MMIAGIAASVLALSGAAQEPVKLNRVFAKGEKAQYEVKSGISSEQRVIGLETWMPEDFDIQYVFSYEVTEMKADGICVMRYKRPTITEIEGETVDAPPKKKVQKVDWDLSLTVSPINELLEVTDLSKKKPDPKKPGGGGSLSRELLPLRAAKDPSQLGPLVGPFISEVHRLALFVGSLDSCLDFSPKLPLDEVKPGDTWKRTVGYSPQKMQGKDAKMAVQRLDYTYTYKGLVDAGGAKVHRITADLALSTDLATFVHQIYDVKPDQTGLKEIPLSLKAAIEFDLDARTHRTIRARASSSGGFKIVATFRPDQPMVEERFKGETRMRQL